MLYTALIVLVAAPTLLNVHLGGDRAERRFRLLLPLFDFQITASFNVGMAFVGFAIVLYGHAAQTPAESCRACVSCLWAESRRQSFVARKVHLVSSWARELVGS